MSNFSDNFRDWLYVFCIAVQTIISILALVWFKYFLKNKEAQRREQRRGLDERKKMIELAYKYCDCTRWEYSVQHLRSVNKWLKEMVFFVKDTVKITGIDVLRYMCQQENHKFMFKTEDFACLCSDVEDVMDFINKVAWLLPLAEDHSINVKKELAKNIAVASEFVFNFCSEDEQLTIIEVAKAFHLSVPQLSEMDVKKFLPYVDRLKYGVSYEEREMFNNWIQIPSYRGKEPVQIRFENLNVSSQLYSVLDMFDMYLQKGLELEKYEVLVGDIQTFWNEHFNEDLLDVEKPEILPVNLLHGIRMLKNELLSDVHVTIMDDTKFKKVVDNLTNIINLNKENKMENVTKCKQLICKFSQFFNMENRKNDFFEFFQRTAGVKFMEKFKGDVADFKSKHVTFGQDNDEAISVSNSSFAINT